MIPGESMKPTSKCVVPWMYLYRAVDSAGHTLEFMLSPYRHAGAAECFFRKALGQAHTVMPRVVNVDQNAAYPSAVEAL
jgi:IS6 family transposase